ncbi:hypothetical protein K461DRAFT_269322 [Myriangium duriaei CBS 260.36]|uniref:R3H-associated N-terminal domain-containing protein n=1 Tax=Myriangium duriaei CBS 260.36 TaxID=1168546 RepID=A0A9P4IW44_9PEZI|nr:hypothetical protein K461DRAFT_269322 [Myriangium duriaei CBS 260.36]
MPPPSTPMASRHEAVESWTLDQTAHLLARTSISGSGFTSRPAPPATPPSIPRGTSLPIAIPLDAPTPRHLAWTPNGAPPAPAKDDKVHTVYRRRSPIQRDSLARREALLRGKEGSRRRQRWENDRLLGVPGAVAAQPEDWAVPAWEPRDDYRPVPYFLAPLWEGKYASLYQERLKKGEAEGKEKEKVARELRARMKKARGARGLLQDLEEEVRDFLTQMEKKRRERVEEGLGDVDESDEEIVFVGRNGAMSDAKTEDKKMEKLIFQSLERDHGAAFGRWLVHSIADYYGLDTWSVTTGNPARREAYVGLKAGPGASDGIELPRPLWVLV